MQKFFEQFHALTERKYEYLRLQSLTLDPDRNVLDVVFAVPYEVYKDAFDDRDKEAIERACKALLPSQFELRISYSRCVADEQIVRGYLHGYLLREYKALIGQVDEARVEVKTEPNKITVSVPATDYIAEYCRSAQVDRKIAEYLESRYAIDTVVHIVADGKIDTSAIIEREYEVLYVDTGTIKTSFHRCLIGKKIDGVAKYIDKYREPKEGLCVCGTVCDFQRLIAKKNNRVYYTFALDDTTGKMACAAFSRSTKKGALDGLKNGDTVIVNGNLVEDTFRKGNKLIVNALALCNIDLNDVAQRRAQAVKQTRKRAKLPKPIPYVDTEPKSLLDIGKQPCAYLQNNSIVVFDLETTGINQATDRIIEIGAVKIVNGEIVSIYETMVYPKMPIPPQASQVNHIYDEQVKDATYIEDVLDGFLEYCDGCDVAAHNAPFDVGFIRNACTAQGKTFEHTVVDTLKLAQKLRPDLGRFNLGYLCRTYGIDLSNAHRAYYDAEATAKLLIRLANESDMQRA